MGKLIKNNIGNNENISGNIASNNNRIFDYNEKINNMQLKM